MSIDVEQFHQVFFDESEEHLENMEQLLMAIDPASPDSESLNSIFRAAHSIKGGSGIFGFSGLGGLTHVMENLRDKARHGAQLLTADIINQLLHTTDLLKSILDDYRSGEPINQDEIDKGILALEKTINEDGASSMIAEGSDETFGFFDDVEQSEKMDSDAFGFFDEEESNNETSADDKQSSPDDIGFGLFDEEPSEKETVATNTETVKERKPPSAVAPTVAKKSTSVE
jgi:two-component system chemotaxis sensor kinase CheA